jgi:hypothetical protein
MQISCQFTSELILNGCNSLSMYFNPNPQFLFHCLLHIQKKKIQEMGSTKPSYFFSEFLVIPTNISVLGKYKVIKANFNQHPMKEAYCKGRGKCHDGCTSLKYNSSKSNGPFTANGVRGAACSETTYEGDEAKSSDKNFLLHFSYV